MKWVIIAFLPQEKYCEMDYLDDDGDEQIEKISYYWDLRANVIIEEYIFLRICTSKKSTKCS